PMEELAELKTSEFIPARAALAITFASDRGTEVETWSTEASDVEHVRHLMEISRLMGRMVGLPLSQATAGV
ncbi:MAG TPA: hypothetical protein V6D47_22525, partial [Oscillatoriaceae cyanobacterium]